MQLQPNSKQHDMIYRLRTRKKIMINYRLLLLSLFFSYSISAEPIDQLINQRLDHMKSVAVYKWHNTLPIEDLAREKVVLDLAVKQGLDLAIVPESSQDFFQLQIEAAKEIQAYWFAHWTQNPESAPQNSTDLIRVIRPELIELGNKIVTALASSNSINSNKVHVQGLSQETALQLGLSAQKIRKFTSRLDQILATNTLRVGTTGDYAPFSFRKGDSYQGIDIDLAKNLAKSLGVELILIETSWPTLMEDFNLGKFDIGMSGISINLQRQQTAFFSLPYHKGGKTAIIRCTDVGKFNTLSSIDDSSVRVIVNPGGTNEKFVQKNINNASVISHKDNRTIFLEIASKNADVMITDAIEIRLQTKRIPELCAATPGIVFTVSEKGLLLPQDPIWKNYVDTWLRIRSNDQTINKVFEQHLH
jgi:cyclohexadienyl dehydratase